MKSKYIASLILVSALTDLFCLVGCAGTAADTDFRRKVQESDTTLNGSFDPNTKVTSGQITNRLVFRNPDSSK